MTPRNHRWPLTRLGTIAEFRNGINFSKDNFGTGIKVIGVSDFQNNVRVSFDNLEQINPEGIVRKEHLLKNGDVLFVRSNGNRELIGRSMFVDGLQEDVTHSAFSIRLRIISDACHPRFYAYLFRSELIRQSLSLHGGGTNISNLNQDILGRLEVPLPPKEVQCKIASILSTYDDLIDNDTRRIRILEEMAQMIYREWFVQFRFPGHRETKMQKSDIGLIPKGWRILRFTEISEILSGGTPKTSTPEYWNGEIPFFGPTDAPTGFFVTETNKTITRLGLNRCNSDLYPAETVFITARGTVGKVALPAEEMAMNQSCYALIGKSGISQLFLFMLTKQCAEELRKKAHGAVFDTITIETFSKLSVVRPAGTLPQRFDDTVRPLFVLMLALQRTIMNLQKSRDLLLSKLVSGDFSMEHVETEAVAQGV